MTWTRFIFLLLILKNTSMQKTVEHRKNIGVLVNGLWVNYYELQIINLLKESPNAHLFILIYGNSDPQNIRSHRNFRTIVFKSIEKCEKKYFLPKIEQTANISSNQNLKQGISTDETDFLELSTHLADKDIFYLEAGVKKNISTLNLDLIIVGDSFPTGKSALTNFSKDGALTVDYWDSEKLPAFYETLYDRPSTSFHVYLIKGNKKEVVLKGSFPTQDTYIQNLTYLMHESNIYLKRLIARYIDGEPFENESTNRLPENIGGQIPTCKQSFDYVFKSLFDKIKTKIQSSVLHKERRWSVAYWEGDWKDYKFSRAKEIKDPPGHFYADPFIVTQNNRTVCFVEDFVYQTDLGHIAAIEIINGQEYKTLGPVIQEPFHMSFPYLFRFQNGLYMVPETYQSHAIRLYKCTEFPMKWEYVKDLMQNCKAVDTMIFEKDGKWWLMTNLIPKGNLEENSALHIFCSDNPLSDDWTPLPSNPVILTSEYARNGGILFERGEIFRVRQFHGGKRKYGQSFSIAKIETLNTDNFKEKEIKKVVPDFKKDFIGTHTFNANEHYTVFDFLRIENIRK